MTLETLALVAFVLAAIPCGLFLVNLTFYRRTENLSLTPGFSQVPAPGDVGEDLLSGFPSLGGGHTGLEPGANKPRELEAVSVLIPARNEEQNIRATLESVVANRGIEFEVVVLDDHSTDRTPQMVRAFAERDPRVRLESAPPLPPGWCGKQHACHVLAGHARHPLLLFMDSDVRLAPDALARMAGFMTASGGRGKRAPDMPGAARDGDSCHSSLRVALASGVPRQELGNFSEGLLIPLIHFVLLGYLPMFMMRWTRRPEFSAGCGQLFVARADAYHQVGGHSQIRRTLHDGVKLPRAFRRAGFKTNLFDATDIATCRMYHTNAETWRGLGKNATEGLAAPGTILPMSALLFGGQVLPFMLLALAPWLSVNAIAWATAAGVLAYLPRLVAAWKFKQPVGTVLLHPLGVIALLTIQWLALMRSARGRPSEWKGRRYATSGVSQPARAA